jgi:hypothetical protein
MTISHFWDILLFLHLVSNLFVLTNLSTFKCGKERGQTYVELLVQHCATLDAGKTQVQVKHATFEKAMYVELIILIENKVYTKNMLFANVFDLRAYVIFDSRMVPSCATMVLEIHNYEIH